MNATTTASATFFRVEGVLLRRPTLAAAGWLAANSQTMSRRLLGLGSVLAAAPLTLPGPLNDRTTATRLAWAGLRDVSDDRLHILGEQYYRDQLADHVRESGRRLLEAARKRGDRLVLISDNLDVIVQHLADDLGAHDLICNRMELRGDRATGRLQDPVVSAFGGGPWLRRYAAEHGLDLQRCAAAGHTADDAVLLSSVGRPCAVEPDAGLRRMARDLDWPIVVDRQES